MKIFIVPFVLLSIFSRLTFSLFIEGDILAREETDHESDLETAGGVILADPSKLWPGGYVYYRFDRTFQNPQHVEQVENMMRYIETKVEGCITFEKSETKVDFVSITGDGGDKGSGTSCFSDLGRIGGKQILNLDISCLRNQTIVHELMHTVGFNHEHNRPDRDTYVTVVTENILENKKGNFKKRERGNSKWFMSGNVDTMNTPFDFMSVLLYPPSISNSKSVSKNGKKTLKYNDPLIASWPEFPPDEEPLTVIDTVELSLAYSCRVDQGTLIQYVHYNRLSSSQKISNMNRKFEQQIQNLELKLEDIEKTIQTLSTEITGCDVDWTQFGSRCYKYFGDKLSWSDAQSRCEQEGSHLASVLSPEENQFLVLLDTSDDSVWLGGNDIDMEGTWLWTDGSAWNYHNWYPNNPSNSDGGEHCAHIYYTKEDGLWNDNNCGYTSAFICKKK